MTLIVFSGLPGTGKTTIARALARALHATYLRVHAVEQTIRDAGVLAGEVGPTGYAVAQAIAEANVADGRTVVADCANPSAASRNGWRAVASRAAAQLIEVEVVCSNLDEHRRRVRERDGDIPGLQLPTWEDVLRKAYEPWDCPHVIVDSAILAPAAAVAALLATIG